MTEKTETEEKHGRGPLIRIPRKPEHKRGERVDVAPVAPGVPGTMPGTIEKMERENIQVRLVALTIDQNTALEGIEVLEKGESWRD